MKERISWIDTTKGIAILLVIIGHTIPKTTFLYKFIFSFHMPIFFILSGYLFHETDIKKLSIRNLKRMIIPYLGTSLIILILNFIRLLVKHDLTSVFTTISSLILAIAYGCGAAPIKFFISIQHIGAIWFLLCLFFAEIFFLISLNLTYKLKSYIQAIIFMCLSFAGYFLGQYIFLPWNIDISLVALIFLYVGYIFRKHNVINHKINIGVLMLSFILWGNDIYIGSMDMAERKYGDFIVCVLGAIAASYLVIKLCEFISRYSVANRYFSFLGKETLVILCFHLLEMNFFPWDTIIRVLCNTNNILIYIIFKIIYANIIALLIKLIPVIKMIYYYEKNPLLKSK